MGLFSNSSSKSKQTVNTTTTTISTIRDIGLTGANAEGALRTLGELEVARTAAWRDSFSLLTASQGGGGSLFGGGSMPLLLLAGVGAFLVLRR